MSESVKPSGFKTGAAGPSIVLVPDPESARWTIEIREFASFRDAIGPDVLSAFCQCFVHAERLTSLISCAFISEKHYGTDAIPFQRNLHTTVWFTIGTLWELTTALAACRAALKKRNRLEVDSAPWQTLRAFERRWAGDQLVARLRNKAAFHVDGDVVRAGIDELAKADVVVLSKGEGAKADQSSLSLGLSAVFSGLEMTIDDYREFMEKVGNDQGIGEAVQEAFIHATEQAGVPFGPAQPCRQSGA